MIIHQSDVNISSTSIRLVLIISIMIMIVIESKQVRGENIVHTCNDCDHHLKSGQLSVESIQRDASVTSLSSLSAPSASLPASDKANKNASAPIEMVWLEQLVTRLVPVLFGCIFVTGLIGNMLVVIVVVRNASMRNTTNLLILNLALADLLFIVFCVPFTACDYALAYWPFGDTWCRVVQYLILVLACASVYTLVLMSLDRFLAVVYPVNSINLRTSRNTAYALLTMWIAILSIGAPALLTHGVLSYEFGPSNRMYLACRYNGNWLISYSTFQLTFFVISYVAPLCIALILYVCMLHRLWINTRQAGSNRRRRKKVTRMVVIVLLIFALSWAPIQLMLVCRSLQICSMKSTLAVMLQIGAQVLAYMNSCVNPILYAFLSENFRKAFRRVILCEVDNRNLIQGNVTTQQQAVTCNNVHMHNSNNNLNAATNANCNFTSFNHDQHRFCNNHNYDDMDHDDDEFVDTNNNNRNNNNNNNNDNNNCYHHDNNKSNQNNTKNKNNYKNNKKLKTNHKNRKYYNSIDNDVDTYDDNNDHRRTHMDIKSSTTTVTTSVTTSSTCTSGSATTSAATTASTTASTTTSATTASTSCNQLFSVIPKPNASIVVSAIDADCDTCLVSSGPSNTISRLLNANDTSSNVVNLIDTIDTSDDQIELHTVRIEHSKSRCDSNAQVCRL